MTLDRMKQLAAEARRSMEKSIGVTPGWAFFNPEKVERPIIDVIAAAYAEGLRDGAKRK